MNPRVGRPWQIPYQPPVEPAAYIVGRQWAIAIDRHYRPGECRRRKPCPVQLPPFGTWRIEESICGIHGHEIDVLCEIDPRLLLRKEDLVETNTEGRGWDAERYAGWLREGLQPPPIEVTQFGDGTGRLVVSNGHRRHSAALATGTRIAAWVSPVMPHPQGLCAAGENVPMLVGMTYEAMTGRPWQSCAIEIEEAQEFCAIDEPGLACRVA